MRRVGIILVILLLGLKAVAQPRLREPEMYVGLHGGVLFSMTLFTPKVAGSDILTDRTLLSGNGGLVFRYVGHKVCGFQVELNYMQRGWRENTDEVDGNFVHYTRRLNYFEVPFLAHIYFGKTVRGFLNLGPQIGVCFLEQESGTKNKMVGQQAQYQPIDNKFDWGVAGGLGMLVRTSKVGTFQLEARVSYSLGDYFSNKKTDPFSHSNSLDVSANIGYMWEIKDKRK